MADLKTLKGVADKDKRMIADAEALVGPEPSTMGFVKNLFWGNLREELVFPYPQVDADENARLRVGTDGSSGGGKHVGAAGQRDQRKRAQAGAAVVLEALPAGRQRQSEGNEDFQYQGEVVRSFERGNAHVRIVP